jgi:hypothetical protein
MSLWVKSFACYTQNSFKINEEAASSQYCVSYISAFPADEVVVRFLASTSRRTGLRDSELEKLEGRKELFILYFIKTNVICALRTACVYCAVVGGH